MHSPDIAIMVILLALILTTGGVLVLRPIAKRLAELLHVMTQDRLAGGTRQEDLSRVRDVLVSLETRLSSIEERQSFAEALLESGARVPELATPRAESTGRLDSPAS